MPSSCAAVNCKNRFQKGNGVTMHKFPIKDSKLLQRWLFALRRVKFYPNASNKLCSEHFAASDFRYCNDRKYLKADTVPSKFNFPTNLTITITVKNAPIKKSTVKKTHAKDTPVTKSALKRK